jgi:hypothetical protein
MIAPGRIRFTKAISRWVGSRGSSAGLLLAPQPTDLRLQAWPLIHRFSTATLSPARFTRQRVHLEKCTRGARVSGARVDVTENQLLDACTCAVHVSGTFPTASPRRHAFPFPYKGNVCGARVGGVVISYIETRGDS